MVTENKPSDDFTGRIKSLVDESKRNTQWRKQYMEWEREKTYIREDAMEQKAVEAARSFYANGVSIDIIAKSLGMTEDQVKEIVGEPSPAN